MGTHGAIALTMPNGKHMCVERTMDGNLVHMEYEVLRAVQQGPTALIELGLELYARPRFGTGSVQYDKDREHAHYGNFMHIDAKNRILTLTWLDPEGYDPEEPLDPQRVAGFRRALQRHGWRLVTDEGDCPHP